LDLIVTAIPSSLKQGPNFIQDNSAAPKNAIPLLRDSVGKEKHVESGVTKTGM